MISFFRLAHRFKRGMLEIISETPDDILDKYLDPTQTGKLPEYGNLRSQSGKKNMISFAIIKIGRFFILKE